MSLALPATSLELPLALPALQYTLGTSVSGLVSQLPPNTCPRIAWDAVAGRKPARSEWLSCPLATEQPQAAPLLKAVSGMAMRLVFSPAGPTPAVALPDPHTITSQARKTHEQRIGQAGTPHREPPGRSVVRPTSRQLCWRATMGAVDPWPLATSSTINLGVSPGRYPLRRDLRTVSSSGGVHVALCDGAPAPKPLCSGQPCEKLSGGNWMVVSSRTGPVPHGCELLRCV